MVPNAYVAKTLYNCWAADQSPLHWDELTEPQRLAWVRVAELVMITAYTTHMMLNA